MTSPSIQPPWVLVALGANLGDPESQILRAMDRLDQLVGARVRRSRLYRSEPLDCPPGSPWFVNAGVAFEAPSRLNPESLLKELQSIERDFGRVPKTVLNEARPLDLDLIAWGGERRDTPFLVLPHPRTPLRRFVVEPLADVLPDFVLPGQSKTLAELLVGL